MILLQSPSIEVTMASGDRDGDTVAILFYDRSAGAPKASKDFISEFLKKENQSALIVAIDFEQAIDREWQQAAAVIVEAARGYRRRIAYGVGAAGYAALRLYGVDAVIAIAPQAPAGAHRDSWIAGLSIAGADPARPTILVSDPAVPDQRLPDSVAALIGGSQHLPVPFSGRGIAQYLRKHGFQSGMLRQLADDTFDVRMWRNTIRSARRGHASYFQNLAAALRLSKPAIALRAGERAVELDSSNADTYNLFGRLLIGADRFAEAVAAAQQAIALKGELSKYLILLGEALHGAGRHAEAVTAYRRAEEVGPRHHSIYLGLARSSAQLGDLAGAEEALQSARDVGATEGAVKRAEFDVYRELGADGPPVIFATSPTSGTASMQRIVRTIAKGWQVIRVNAPAANAPGPDRTFLDPNARKTIYWFQGGSYWNKGFDLTGFRAIVHLRDARDLACNQYWWALQHPNTIDTPEVAEQKRVAVKEMGIDGYVMISDNRTSLNMIKDITDRLPPSSVVCTSYAQLCCTIDLIFHNLCELFQTDLRQAADRLILERPENIQTNSQWVKVGGTWQGADISPGRFRRELQPETVEPLTAKFSDYLAMMQRLDAPFLAYHYQ